ncbi:MAG: hypothetical protein ACI9DK_000569 [Vicingaceae bacterium]|jgi:hypothetical protein
MGFSSHTRSQTNRDNLYAKSIKRRGSYFKLKAEFLEATKKEGLDFKEAWPYQIKAIKEKLRAQKIEEKKQFYKAIIASVISGVILFFGISWMIRFIFF